MLSTSHAQVSAHGDRRRKKTHESQRQKLKSENQTGASKKECDKFAWHARKIRIRFWFKQTQERIKNNGARERCRKGIPKRLEQEWPAHKRISRAHEFHNADFRTMDIKRNAHGVKN